MDIIKCPCGTITLRYGVTVFSRCRDCKNPLYYLLYMK